MNRCSVSRSASNSCDVLQKPVLCTCTCQQYYAHNIPVPFHVFSWERLIKTRLLPVLFKGPLLVAIQFWLPFFYGASQSLPSWPGINLWCDGGKKCESSGKKARNISNSSATLIVPSKKQLTLKTTDQTMSSFKFPTVSHPHKPLQSWSCQLRKYHWSWRLMPSLRQMFCTQRAAVMIPFWRSGSSITKLQRCQTDTWLARDFLSYLLEIPSENKTDQKTLNNIKLTASMGWDLRVCFNTAVFLIEEKYDSCT